MEIVIDDLSGPEVAELLDDHLKNMATYSPRESRHALDLDSLRAPEITFWSAWENAELVGCAALKELDTDHGEIKSMKTATPHLRKGIATQLLQHLIAEAVERNYRRLSLETGSMSAFEPARRLYSRFGFEYCRPFGSFKSDSNSVFMTKLL